MKPVMFDSWRQFFICLGGAAVLLVACGFGITGVILLFGATQ